MNNKFVTCIFLLCCGYAVNAQNAYYDALLIKDQHWAEEIIIPDVPRTVEIKFTKAQFNEQLQLFIKYLPQDSIDKINVQPDLEKKYNILKNTFAGNPFLTLPETVQDLKEIKAKVGIVAKSALNTIGGLDVTNFADGLARFMVERAKEELNVYFFDQFQQAINEQPDLRLLFPATHRTLLVAKDRIYDYQLYLPALQEAFENDLRELLNNAQTWITANTEIIKKIKNKKEVYAMIRAVLDIAAFIDDGTHPGDVIHQIKNNTYLDSLHQNVRPSFSTFDLFSQGLRSGSGDRYWISNTEFYLLLQDPLSLKIFLGLIYQLDHHTITFSSGASSTLTLKSLLTRAAQELVSYHEIVNLLKRIQKHQQDIEAIIASIKNKTEVPAEDYFNLFHQTLNASSMTMGFTGENLNQENFQKLQYYAKTGGRLLANIRTRSYHAAVFDAYTLLDTLVKTQTPLKENFLRYGTFMASVALAKNSDDVKNAIETVALSVGSSRIKRESAVNISLNGYLGAFIGRERLAYKKSNQWATGAGIFAPVGIAFSKGSIKNKNTSGGKSATLFVSLIDVGALAAFRFKDDSSSVSSDITLKNIIAPGAYAVWGFGKSPLSAGIGAQFGPMLREVDPQVLKINHDYYVRFQFFIAVDIPFLNFYNRRK